jgi:hypothetical protein
MVGRVSPPSLPGLTRQSIFFVKRSCEGMDPRVKPACLAAPCRDGKSIRHHGTYKEDSEYEANDAAALNGGSFVALRDHPGPCPSPGWQLLAASGKRGVAGERGPQGDRGPTGAAGKPGKDAITIVCWTLDRAGFCAIPTLSDGTNGPPLNLRELFEQFLHEVG